MTKDAAQFLTHLEQSELQAAWSDHITKLQRKAIRAGDHEQVKRLASYHIRVANKLNGLQNFELEEQAI